MVKFEDIFLHLTTTARLKLALCNINFVSITVVSTNKIVCGVWNGRGNLLSSFDAILAVIIIKMSWVPKEPPGNPEQSIKFWNNSIEPFQNGNTFFGTYLWVQITFFHSSQSWNWHKVGSGRGQLEVKVILILLQRHYILSNKIIKKVKMQ